MPLSSELAGRLDVALFPAIQLVLAAPSSRTRAIALAIGLAVVAVLAALVAAAAYQGNPKHRKRDRWEDDSELFTTTPLPMPKEELERMAAEGPPHLAFREHRLPRWVQVGSLVAAIAITWVAALRIRAREQAAPEGPTPAASAAAAVPPGSVAEAIPAERRALADDDAGAPFAFRVRDWVPIDQGAGCAGRFEVTTGSATAWDLVARVHDETGSLVDTARVRVSSLRAGEALQFTFTRAACGRIGTWDISGDRRVE